ncbi:hypothetical protein [Dongia deserti]|uniref:hypothetical protein n=1 Tax=Dongia deserti TaxID=2268030 RepID=UPI000E646EE4|nr:hypothetical protein [Dongia deserti]
MFRSIVAAVVAAVALCACSHEVKTIASPATSVRPADGAKLPGSYVLVVQSDKLIKTVDPSSFTCGGPEYPIDARASFKQSARDTMIQLVEALETAEQALTPEQLQAGKHRGQIVLETTAYDAQLDFNPGLFSATADATVTIGASLIVDGPAGRLLQAEESDTRTVEHDVVTCGDGAEVLAEANSKATVGLLERLAERFSTAPRLRTAALP